MRGLLDTSVVIALEATDLPDEAAISAATLAEIHFGVHLAKDLATRGLRLRRLAEIESRFTALAIDEAVARACGELAALTVDVGRQVRPRVMDLLIAGPLVLMASLSTRETEGTSNLWPAWSRSRTPSPTFSRGRVARGRRLLEMQGFRSRSDAGVLYVRRGA